MVRAVRVQTVPSAVVKLAVDVVELANASNSVLVGVFMSVGESVRLGLSADQG